MSVIRMIARPMLAAVFVVQGFHKLRTPEEMAARAKPVTDRMAPVLQKYNAPTDATTLVRISGAIDLGGGLLLATGRLPRLAASALAASLVPTTIAGHPFWQADDPAARAEQRVHFLKNAGLAGGLLLASVDTEGRPGLRWRAKRSASDTKRAARTAKREAKLAMRAARAEASQKAHHVIRR